MARPENFVYLFNNIEDIISVANDLYTDGVKALRNQNPAEALLVFQAIDFQLKKMSSFIQEEKRSNVWNIKPKFFGILHDSKYCKNENCECHIDPEKRVRTPFPDDMGNPYCCGKCALAKFR